MLTLVFVSESEEPNDDVALSVESRPGFQWLGDYIHVGTLTFGPTFLAFSFLPSFRHILLPSSANSPPIRPSCSKSHHVLFQLLVLRDSSFMGDCDVPSLLRRKSLEEQQRSSKLRQCFSSRVQAKVQQFGKTVSRRWFFSVRRGLHFGPKS